MKAIRFLALAFVMAFTSISAQAAQSWTTTNISPNTFPGGVCYPGSTYAGQTPAAARSAIAANKSSIGVVGAANAAPADIKRAEPAVAIFVT